MRLLPVGAVARRGVSRLGSGFVDQAASSGTNLLLTIAAARVLGAHSLGVVVIGFTAYLVLVGLQRVLVTQPLVISTAAAAAGERRDSSRCALTIVLSGGAVAGALMAASGVAAGGSAGHGWMLFAAWMPCVLLQDFWRSMLFRDSRGGAAAANDLLWLAVMVLALPGAWVIGTDWGIVGAWGIGGLAAAVAGFWQTRVSPVPLTIASRAWRTDLWPFGRWLLGGGMIYIANAQASIFLTGALLGPAALGGFRAVNTVFAPLNFLGPAIALPALPIMVRKLAAAASDARVFAFQLSALLVVLATAYVLIVGAVGTELLAAVFGASFVRYESLILPVAVMQIIASAGRGFDLLLNASKRGRAIVVVQATSVPLVLGVIVIGAAMGGLVGVAWGLVVTTAAVTLMTGAFALAKSASPITVRAAGTQL